MQPTPSSFLCYCETVATLAPSSSSSCSPPEARHYNLHSKRAKTTYKMASNCAICDQSTTKIFLDLCIVEKNQLNFNNKGPTKLGWQHVYRGFREQTGLRYENKQLQNKLTSLRRAYMQWLHLQNQTGLGRDRNTGGIAADDSYWELQDGGDTSDDQNRGKPLSFLDELSTLFGRTPQYRGALLWAGGVRESTPTIGSDDNPQEMSQDPVAASTAGSKRTSRDVVVDNPPKKKTASLEDYVRDISETVAMRTQRRLSREQEELDLTVQILENDGIPEGSDLFCKALWLCKNAVNRRAFTTMKTKEGCLHWINFNWENK